MRFATHPHRMIIFALTWGGLKFKVKKFLKWSWSETTYQNCDTIDKNNFFSLLNTMTSQQYSESSLCANRGRISWNTSISTKADNWYCDYSLSNIFYALNGFTMYSLQNERLVTLERSFAQPSWPVPSKYFFFIEGILRHNVVKS